MKISFNWLCEILPGLEKYSPYDIASKLTFSGLEVEEITDLSKRYLGIVVGHVLKKEKHPNADKLSLCEVDAGNEIYKVVCGAKNVEQGKKFPFATKGTVMPDGLVIKPVKLRGVESNGMLCSSKELELSADADGLLELSSDLEVGKSISAALNLEDVIFEINITPNRGDALSHWGVAKDISALTGLKADFTQIAPETFELTAIQKQNLL